MSSRQKISEIIDQLEKVQQGRLWMGDHFRKKIDSITEEEAFSRPHPSMHTPAELVAHLLAWRKDAMMKIKTGKGELRERDPENWPDNDHLQTSGWHQLINDYETSLQDVIRLIRDKDDRFLEEHYEDQDFEGRFSYSFMLNGLVHHDIYHMGQLGIVIKLIKEQKQPNEI